MRKKCPKCNSEDLESVDYLNIKAVKCKKCGFDETEEYEVFPEQRETQREKTRFTPYKKGGRGRTKKY